MYRDQGKLEEAKDIFVRALAGYEKALGPEHTSTMDTILCLGASYKDQGKLGKVEDMYVRVLAGYEKTLGPEHKTVMVRRCITNLTNPPKSKTRRVISRLFKNRIN